MPAAWVEAWRLQPFQLLGDVEGALDHRIASRSACSRGSPSIARASVTGAAGFCGTSLHSLSTCPYGICSTRPTSRNTPRACSVPKVMICATWSRP